MEQEVWHARRFVKESVVFEFLYLTNSVLLSFIQAVFHNFIAENKDGIFHDGADTVMERLSKAAESVGAALKGSLRDLAEKVCPRYVLTQIVVHPS